MSVFFIVLFPIKLKISTSFGDNVDPNNTAGLNVLKEQI